MSSALEQNQDVRVLVAEDHVAVANRIGEGLRDAGSRPQNPWFSGAAC
jgi:hypothetical protein